METPIRFPDSYLSESELYRRYKDAAEGDEIRAIHMLTTASRADPSLDRLKVVRAVQALAASALEHRTLQA